MGAPGCVPGSGTKGGPPRWSAPEEKHGSNGREEPAGFSTGPLQPASRAIWPPWAFEQQQPLEAGGRQILTNGHHLGDDSFSRKAEVPGKPRCSGEKPMAGEAEDARWQVGGRLIERPPEGSLWRRAQSVSQGEVGTVHRERREERSIAPNGQITVLPGWRLRLCTEGETAFKAVAVSVPGRSA